MQCQRSYGQEASWLTSWMPKGRAAHLRCRVPARRCPSGGHIDTSDGRGWLRVVRHARHRLQNRPPRSPASRIRRTCTHIRFETTVAGGLFPFMGRICPRGGQDPVRSGHPSGRVSASAQAHPGRHRPRVTRPTPDYPARPSARSRSAIRSAAVSMPTDRRITSFPAPAPRVADVGQMRPQLNRLHDLDARLVTAFQAEREDRAGATG